MKGSYNKLAADTAELVSNLNLAKRIYVVLSALFQGHAVEIDGREYIWNDGLCVIAWKITYEHVAQEVPLRVDMDLDTFINLVAKLSLDEIFMIGADVVLTEVNRDSHRDRA